MSLDKLIESQIQEAMASGAFDNLAGAGKPLPPVSELEKLAGDNWLGFKVLQNGGFVPEWLELGREIERDLCELSRLEERYLELCSVRNACEATSDEADPDDLADLRVLADDALCRYESLARKVRGKQERFNFKAPGPRSQRAPIWVEYQLERLRAAGQNV